MNETDNIIEKGIHLFKSGDREGAHQYFLSALDNDPKNIRSLKYALITSSTQEEANIYISELRSLGISGKNFENVVNWSKTLPNSAMPREQKEPQLRRDKSSRKILTIGIISLLTVCGIICFLLFIPQLLNQSSMGSNNLNQKPKPTLHVKRTLPPIWTPTRIVSPTTVRTAIPITTPTSMPINTPVPFRGYKPVEMNNQNYPIVDPVAYYSYPDNYYKKRFMVSGYVVSRGYIDMGSGPEYVIQVGVNLHEPRGSIVARSPILLMRMDPDFDLYQGQKIDIYGSGGKSIQGTNTAGGNASFPVVYGEHVQSYVQVYQQNNGYTNSPSGGGTWYNYPFP